VHLYGQPAQMGDILALASKENISVIEDACQAHGAFCSEGAVGSLGDMAAFSFYPTKNLGCWGDGGIITTNSEELAERVRRLRNYGQQAKYLHTEQALNRRLDTLQAYVLSRKMVHLDNWNALRKDLAATYRIFLSGTRGVQLLSQKESVFHLFVVRVNGRDAVCSRLKEVGIGTGIHYPYVLAPGFPVAENAARTVLSLPLYPGMDKSLCRYVSSTLLDII
jgi:dTDP-4-amino-4,6-dideoxygalactose transaminase